MFLEPHSSYIPGIVWVFQFADNGDIASQELPNNEDSILDNRLFRHGTFKHNGILLMINRTI